MSFNREGDLAHAARELQRERRIQEERRQREELMAKAEKEKKS